MDANLGTDGVAGWWTACFHLVVSLISLLTRKTQVDLDTLKVLDSNSLSLIPWFVREFAPKDTHLGSWM